MKERHHEHLDSQAVVYRSTCNLDSLNLSGRLNSELSPYAIVEHLDSLEHTGCLPGKQSLLTDKLPGFDSFWRWCKTTKVMQLMMASVHLRSSNDVDTKNLGRSGFLYRIRECSETQVGVARCPVEVWRGDQVARGPGGVSEEAHTERPIVTCGLLSRSMGSGSTNGNLQRIQCAGRWASLVDVDGHGDVRCDDEGAADSGAIGITWRAARRQRCGLASQVVWVAKLRWSRRRCYEVDVIGLQRSPFQTYVLLR
uniref:Uncharacterized protein n=1 Tax=Leersia perrieri TaxID=77586 RepID=A0A0D9WZQ5_9ORYZ